MPQMLTMSTEGLPPGKGLEFWNDAACESLTAERADPLDPHGFSGRFTQADFGDVRMIEFSSDAATIQRSRSDIARSRDAMFMVRLQTAGESISRQGGQEVRLQAGDFTLYDGTRPYAIAFQERASMLTLRIPRATLLRHVARPETLVMVGMSGSRGASSLTSRCLQDFWHCSEQLEPRVTPRMTNVILELIGSAYAALPGADKSSSSSALQARLFRYIETNLYDMDLTPTSIARALKITPRYLHLLFGGESETAARYILRRRLEKCAEVLADPLQGAHSISDVAWQHGFKTVAHFCRTFREHHGLSPGDWRRTRAVSRN